MIETRLRGFEVLATPLLNKGVAFPPEERDALGLTGLLPPKVLTLEEQAKRAYKQFQSQPDDLSKNVYLTALHDRNEVLFYRLLNDHMTEMRRLSIPRLSERQYSNTAMNTESRGGCFCRLMTLKA